MPRRTEPKILAWLSSYWGLTEVKHQGAGWKKEEHQYAGVEVEHDQEEVAGQSEYQLCL